MDQKSINWLLNELPQLVNQGVLAPEAAESLRRHYGQNGAGERKRNLLTIFAIIGFLLIALGIILILAHNWDSLSRPARLAISTGALFSAQVLAAFALWYKRENPAFSESSAVFLTLILGASIALVSQTYHLTNDSDLFLLTWIFLALPLIYLLKSSAATVLCLALISYWGQQSAWDWFGKQLIWLLLAAVIPFYKSLWQDSSQFRRRFAVLSFSLAVSLPVCFAAAFNHSFFYDFMPFIWPAFFAIIYLADAKIALCVPAWQNSPRFFRIIAGLGIIFSAFWLSFKSAWHFLSKEYIGGAIRFDSIGQQDLILAGVMMILFAALLAQTAGRLDRQGRLLAAAPLAAGAGWFLAHLSGSLAAAVVLNIYLIAVSLMAIVAGIAKENLSFLNGGMLLLAALITARFFDSGISFEGRGAAFVLTGLCFLAANLVMLRRIKKRKGPV